MEDLIPDTYEEHIVTILPCSASPAVSQMTILPSQNQVSTKDPAKTADTAIISQAGRDALSSSSDTSETSVTDGWLSRAAHSDPADAEKLAYGFSHTSDGALVNITDYANGTGPIRYTATDQPVTEENQARFNNLAQKILKERTDLYDTEKAKGTPAAEIVDKLIGFMKAQPTWYLEMSGWSKSVGSD